MARIATTVAALTLAVTAGASMAHAQGMNTSPMSPTSGASTMQQAPQNRAGVPTANPSMAQPMVAPMAPPMPVNGREVPQQPYGATSTPSPMMGAQVMPRQQVPTPAQPFAHLNLPNEPQVGDGAYNGGGVVIEHLADGSTRVVR